MINIIVPMAGRGKRFKDAGYQAPKPFIEFNGKHMFAHRLDNIINDIIFDDIHLVIIILREHKKYINNIKGYLDHIRKTDIVKRKINYDIKTIHDVTGGAAETSLHAFDFINNEDPLWITDCDHLVNEDLYLQNAKEFFDKNKCDGGILCHLADNPKWSFSRINNDRQVIEVAEKRAISNLASTGDYYFSQSKYFKEYANIMISKNDRVNNESYVCPVFNHMIVDNKKIMPYMVNTMVPLGIPSDLERHLGK